MLPSCKDDQDEGHYSIETIEEKTVSDYTGYTFCELEELTVFEYWLYLRDAVIYNLKQTEKGREYLEKCWISEQKNPDRIALRKYFGKHN